MICVNNGAGQWIIFSESSQEMGSEAPNSWQAPTPTWQNRAAQPGRLPWAPPQSDAAIRMWQRQVAAHVAAAAQMPPFAALPLVEIAVIAPSSAATPNWAQWGPTQHGCKLPNGSSSYGGSTHGLNREVRCGRSSSSGSSSDSLHHSQSTADLGSNAFDRVVGRVWRLSQDPQGCHEVQKAIDEAADDRTRASLAHELRTHIWEAARCPFSNFVIQKLITSIRPQSSQFIIDELMAKGAITVARNKYGCRIIQRLLEHCPPDQVHSLTAELVQDAVALSKHSYANYVMQHLLEHGGGEHQHQLYSILLQNVKQLGVDPTACAVLGKALSLVSAGENGVTLAYTICREKGLLMEMSHTRHGHAAAKWALHLAQGPEKSRAISELWSDLVKLRSTRYGRSVAAYLEGGAQFPASGPVAGA